MDAVGKSIVYYCGKEKFYRVRGVTGRTYVFRARGSEILMDNRDFDGLQAMDRGVIRKSEAP